MPSGAAAGRARLSRRHRRPLLLGAAPADPRETRRAASPPTPSSCSARACPCGGRGRARRGASARRRARPPYDARRTYAEFPPALRRVDDRADRPRGGSDRSEHRQACRADPGEPTAPRAGLSGLPRHLAPGPAIRRRPAGSGLRSRPRHRCPFLRFDPVDPQARARSATAEPARQRELLPTHPNIRGSRYYH